MCFSKYLILFIFLADPLLASAQNTQCEDRVLKERELKAIELEEARIQLAELEAEEEHLFEARNFKLLVGSPLERLKPVSYTHLTLPTI